MAESTGVDADYVDVAACTEYGDGAAWMDAGLTCDWSNAIGT